MRKLSRISRFCGNLRRFYPQSQSRAPQFNAYTPPLYCANRESFFREILFSYTLKVSGSTVGHIYIMVLKNMNKFSPRSPYYYDVMCCVQRRRSMHLPPPPPPPPPRSRQRVRSSGTLRGPRLSWWCATEHPTSLACTTWTSTYRLSSCWL